MTAHSSAFSRSRIASFDLKWPALGQSQVVQDVLDGRLLVALFGEEPAGGIEDSSFGVSGMHIVRHADGLPFVHVPVKHTDRRSVCQMIEEATLRCD